MIYLDKQDIVLINKKTVEVHFNKIASKLTF